MSVIFWIANAVALAGWAALFGLRAGGARFAQLVALGLCAGYLLMFALFVEDAKLLLHDYSLAGITAFLGTPTTALVGWIHYLAFDLLIGAWETESAKRSAMPRWAETVSLVATLAVGPIGLLLFVIQRHWTGTAAQGAQP